MALAAMGVSAPAYGQSNTDSSALTDELVAVRRVALDRAQQERAAGHHGEALQMAERAGAIQMTASVRLFIAQEQIALGRHADALRSALLCVGEADAASSRREELRSVCQQLVQQERGAVALVQIDPGARRPTGLRVRLNGRELDPRMVGLPNPVDPGLVRVEVEAPGFRSETIERRVEVGALVMVPIALTPAPVSEPTPGPRAQSGERRQDARAPSAGPWVLVATGGVALVGSLVFAVSIGAAQGSECMVSPQGEGTCATVDAARHAETWVPVTVVGAHTSLYAGLALVGGGLLWWGLSRTSARGPDRDAEDGRASARGWVAPWVSASSQGALVGLRGAL